MFPYILCTCGRPIGDVYLAFIAMREAKYRTAIGDIDPNLLSLVEGVQVDLLDIFEALCIPNIPCCRRSLQAQVTLHELI